MHPKNLLFDLVEPPDPRPDDHSATVSLLFREIQARVFDGVERRPNREQGEPIQTLRVFRFAGLPWFEIGNITTKADLVQGGVQDC